MYLNQNVTLTLKHQRNTRRLMWVILVCATATSMAGNIARAIGHTSAADARGSILAAAIPPLALLSLTHLTGMWSRITARGFVYWCFLAAVACITAAAFRLSFDALRTLAMQYGYGRADAALFPLILDGLVAVCTLGLVMLSRIESAEGRDIRDAAPDAAAPRQKPYDAQHPGGIKAASSSDAVVDAEAGVVRDSRPPSADAGAADSDDALVRDEASRVTAARPVTPAVHSVAPHLNEQEPDAHLMLAHQLVHEKRTTAEVAVVHRVLTRTAAKVPSREVAAEVGVSASSVQRIVKAAKAGVVAG